MAATQLTDPGPSPPSIDAIIDRYEPFVRHFVRRLGVPHQDEDDVVAEVFVRVSQGLHGFQGDSTLKTWIGAITTNLIHDYRRHNGRHPEEAVADVKQGDDLIGDREDPAADPHNDLEAREELEEAVSVLSEVHDPFFDVLVLCDIFECTTSCAAALLKIPEGTATSRLRRAREQLNFAKEKWKSHPPKRNTIAVQARSAVSRIVALALHLTGMIFPGKNGDGRGHKGQP